MIKIKKKGIELAMNTIIIAVIVIVVALIIIFVFRHYYGKQTDIIGEQIEGLKGDCDKDGTPDLVDSCPCDNNPDAKCEGEKKRSCFDAKGECTIKK